MFLRLRRRTMKLLVLQDAFEELQTKIQTIALAKDALARGIVNNQIYYTYYKYFPPEDAVCTSQCYNM